MSTADRAARNRSNAQRSTGPKTPAGKALIRSNARRHGLLSTTPVLAGLEDAGYWEHHLQHTSESLHPEGHLESVLVERVALLLWRLARTARYEQHGIEQSQQGIAQEIHQRNQASARYSAPTPGRITSTHPDDIRADAAYTAHMCRLWARLATRPDGVTLPAEDTNSLLNALYTEAVQEEGDDEPLEDWVARTTWTYGIMRAALAAFAAHAEYEPAALLARLTEKARLAAIMARYHAEQLEAQVHGMQGDRLLPEADTLDKITRYEAHIERSLLRTLHELERLQARRQGQQVPLAAVLDVTGLEGQL